MRKIAILLSLICTTTLLYAQVSRENYENESKTESKTVATEDKDNVTEINVAGVEIKVNEDNKVKIHYRSRYDFDDFKGNWAGIELGFNGYAKEDYSNYTVKNFMDLRTIKSINFRLNLVQIDLGIQKAKNNMGFVTGLGIESKNFRFENRYTLQNIEGVTQPEPITHDRLKKSKLHVLYVTAPILFEMQFPTQSNNRFHVSAGLEGGFRLSSHTKIKYNDGDGWKKSKNRNSFNLNDFKLDAQLRIGYQRTHIFFSYALIDLFEKNKGPKLTPITIGINF